MAKKKKTQLKPVNRGFATTSVPKKVTEVVAESEQGAVEDATSDSSKLPGNEKDGDITVVTPLTQEEQEFQAFIEKYQDKTEKEIVRALIEQERRFAGSLFSIALDQTYIERILNLIAESEPIPYQTLNEPEDKLLPRLAITYGVLRRLGFSEERVETCLRAIPGVNLEDAIEWLHVHCPESELGGVDTVPLGNEDDQPEIAKESRTSDHSTGPPSPFTSSSTFETTTLDPHASVFTPSAKTGFSPSTTQQDATELISSPNASSRQGWESPPEDLIAEYVRLKIQIENLTGSRRRHGEKTDAQSLQQLKNRLAAIKDDYLFDEREAQAAYNVEHQRIIADNLQNRLRRPPSPPPPPATPPPDSVKATTSKQPSSPPPPVTNILDEEDEDTGGMFELLEEIPSEISSQGMTIRVRDIAPPQGWSGRTPKALLHETVHKLDRHAVITYRDLSGPSRVKRAAIAIRWVVRPDGDWAMEDVACHDMSQAEQYISTVALHSLIFPRLEGFALGGTSGASTQTSFRLLPPVYRDLWNELEAIRRVEDDKINRGIWAKLRTILQPKLCSSPKVNKPVEKTASSSKRSYGWKPSSGDLSPEQISAGFAARQESSAYQAMLQHRNTLPIAAYRNEIVETLDYSQVLVLSGETGCGKSTQVPAFILEDQLSQGNHCKIYCTEPRRISAISLAQRVSVELGEPAGAVGTMGSVVGYSIRLESNTSRTTRLAFVTNGIALRMLESGSGNNGEGTAFDEITHIIIDEVHERSIESDFLLIVLKSLLQQRPDLKVVLMSATVDAEKISNYFGGCPIIRVPGRTFPVDIRYLEDAIEFTGWKVAENSPYARRGNDKYGRSKPRTDWSEYTAPADTDDEDSDQDNVRLEKRYSSSTSATINLLDERLLPYDLVLRLLERICFEDPAYFQYSAAILVFMPGLAEIRRLNDMLLEHRSFGNENQFRVYPLHSTISSEQQGAVFDVPPPGIRKIVIATNIAETGITIPDITCVIDSGKQREMRFDEKRQISRLVETYVAKSNAAQRRGRAGRVQSGICFHLFTKLRHDSKMAEHPDPEMMRLSLSDLALRIKIMKVKLGSSIEDVLSRALDPPLSVNIQRAVSALVEVRALTPSEDITPMGRLLSKLPTDVHLGKFLLTATLFRCLDPALTIAATLNSKSPFLTPFGLAEQADLAKLSFRVENSDFLTIHNAFSTWRTACNNGVARKLCKNYFLSHQNLMQIEELRQQYLGYLIDSNFIRADKALARELSRSRFNRGRPHFVAVPAEYDVNSGNNFLVNAALVAGLYPKIMSVGTSKEGKDCMRTISNNQTVFFHPSSINHSRKPKDFGVNHLCYFTLMHSKKLYAWETSPVDDTALLLICGEAEFKLMSDIVLIDRKIKFRVEPKSSIALKFLRNQLGQLLASQFRGVNLDETQKQWDELATMVLGKVKIKDPMEREESVTVVVNRVL
ncbi:P-loop containing nucleoside triphosphate hydrolase protein [Abortiporus biennis]|nr:P-loop containing nucleoside triphosphate hydrolase protein [Abortiporus biennis]